MEYHDIISKKINDLLFNFYEIKKAKKGFYPNLFNLKNRVIERRFCIIIPSKNHFNKNKRVILISISKAVNEFVGNHNIKSIRILGFSPIGEFGGGLAYFHLEAYVYE